MQNNVISKSEINFIIEANKFLENPGLLVKITNLIGKPLELAHDKLPENTRKTISNAVQKALKSALALAISSISAQGKTERSLDQAYGKTKATKWIHTAAVTATGAVGGFFGAATLPLELPITTGVILRGISSVADEWGHDLADPSIQMHCIYIFTLGSKNSQRDNALESSYFASRAIFAKMMGEAAKFVGQYGTKELLQALEKGTAPILIRFIAQIAAFFELAVTEKLIAEAIPVVGAIGGATINAAFCDYFVEASRYHFGLLHLEEKYGADSIREIYTEASKSNNSTAS